MTHQRHSYAEWLKAVRRAHPEFTDREVERFVRDIPRFQMSFPHITEDKVIETMTALDRYLDVVFRIMLRVANDPVEYERALKLIAEHRRREAEIDASEKEG